MFYRNTELTGADEATLTDHRRRHVGFVFQFYNLIPSLTARENIALVTEISDNVRGFGNAPVPRLFPSATAMLEAGRRIGTAHLDVRTGR